ncbi:MAG: LipA [Cyanobacteria bacterium RYN_339]|nr:LipA [Cyanobacteria bacterium RYN_339]
MLKRSLILAAALLVTACGHASQITPTLAPAAMLEAARAKGAAYEVTKTVAGSKWEKLERLTSTYGDFPKEQSRPNGKQTDKDTVAAFGDATPASKDVVLHYMKGWDKGQGNPVILVHGAILDATANFYEPHGKPGLAPALAAAGKRVFAVTFAHRHGDNVLQAEQLANAIDRVKAVTGAKEVDVVAHSKGTIVARALASGVRQGWMRSYGHDIHRLVLIGGPHTGLDYPFRHPAINFAMVPELDNVLHDAPMSWTSMIVFGVWVNTSKQSIMTEYGNYFPGQAQMLAKFDKKYPLSKLEQDWYTTYYGGHGFVSVSPGIDAAIAAGGNFMEKLAAHPLDSHVELAVLAGDKQDLAGVLSERTGPSDSVVFVESATATADMTKGGAKLVAKDVLHLNHMDLVIAEQAHNWVKKALD